MQDILLFNILYLFKLKLFLRFAYMIHYFDMLTHGKYNRLINIFNLAGTY